MRKFYSFLSGAFLTLTCLQTNAQIATDSCHADFERVPSTTINPLTAGFHAIPWINSDKKPEEICWNFGDNHDTCIKYDTTLANNYFVAHTYEHIGIYNVCVKILYQGGCLADRCKLIEVGEPDSCSVNFEIVTSTANSLGKYFVARPGHNHNKKPVSICWNFGDNYDTCIQYSADYTGSYSAFHLYANAGSYNVCAKIIYDGGCDSHFCQTLQLAGTDSCTANFERLLTPADNPLRIYYRALQWHNNNKKPEQICWNFGDNHDTCINYSPAVDYDYIVSHAYANAGTYNVCVRILYQGGCLSYKCKLVQIGKADSCGADFETGLISSTPLGRHFTALPWSNQNKKPVYICWNFGDNQDTCIQYSNTNPDSYSINHVYAERGQYEVCVRIVYDGCDARKCKVIQVGEPDNCSADFERIPASATNDHPSFVYYRALPWNNHAKKPARICWLFGDGRDTCISYPENYTGSYAVGHHYDHSGIYEVCVKISYYDGCEAKKCKFINIFFYNTQCRVHVYEIVPYAGSLTRGFYFVSSTDNRPVRVCWNFGDGTDTCIAADPNTTEIPHAIRHTYPAPGLYRACVKVLFLNGCYADNCHEVAIRSFTDLCGGYYTDSLIDPHTYVFNGFSIHKPDDNVIGFRWTFGDGSSGTGEKITHTYNEPGVYRVCLLIYTEKGCETKICNDVRIAGEIHSRLRLSPNPVGDILHAVFYSTHNETVKIKIINANGVVVREYSRSAVVGPNTWDFEAIGLLPGVYSFVVQSPNQFASGIFFKQ